MAEDRESAGNDYEDIISLERPVSRTHPPMDRADRAAQFSPFAALTGFEDALPETGRLTDFRRELDEDEIQILDEKLREIRERIREHPRAAVTYFKPDGKKDGGAYVTVEGNVKRLDIVEGNLIMEDGTRISVRETAELKTDEEIF